MDPIVPVQQATGRQLAIAIAQRNPGISQVDLFDEVAKMAQKIERTRAVNLAKARMFFSLADEIKFGEGLGGEVFGPGAEQASKSLVPNEGRTAITEKPAKGWRAWLKAVWRRITNF